MKTITNENGTEGVVLDDDEHIVTEEQLNLIGDNLDEIRSQTVAGPEETALFTKNIIKEIRERL